VVSCSLCVKVWQGGNFTGADCISRETRCEAPERYQARNPASPPCSASRVVVTCPSTYT
jgi:hypothetical protein